MLIVHELTKTFAADDGEVRAVDRLTFRVAPGEVYGLMGPNGAGKTTTLRMILGLLRPDHGYAEVDSIRTDEAPEAAKARLGFVSANDGVYTWLTVREMLMFFADLYGLEPAFAQQRLDQLAGLLDIKELLDRRAGALSTGQRQRVTLVRGLIHDPPVMLLDEPTRGLDVLGSQTVFDYVAHLRTLGKAVLICTHGLDEAERVCDRFGLLHRGALRHEGTLAELREATGRRHLVEMFIDMLRGGGVQASA